MKPYYLCLLLVGCVPPSSLPALDNTFGSYASALKEENPRAKGLLPKNLEVPELDETGTFQREAMTLPPMWARMMLFDQVAGEQICFTEFDSDADLHADAEDLGKQHLEDVEIRIEALDELPTKRALWPSSGTKLEFKKVSDDKTDNKGVTPVRTIYWQECAPTPAITPATRYLAAVVHHRKPIGHYPDYELLLWELR